MQIKNCFRKLGLIFLVIFNIQEYKAHKHTMKRLGGPFLFATFYKYKNEMILYNHPFKSY